MSHLARTFNRTVPRFRRTSALVTISIAGCAVQADLPARDASPARGTAASNAVAAAPGSGASSPASPRLAASPSAATPDENLTLLDFWMIYSDAPHALYKGVADEALARLRTRKEMLARLESRADWERHRQQTRRKLAAIIGPLPEKTPLDARTLGVVRKEGFRIEKVVYESQPGLHVTAALFIPEPLRGKAPAIIYCSGHTDLAFRAASYQTLIVNFVRKGFIVLAFDPIGQGERLQYFDPATGLSKYGEGSSTREHSRVGAQCFMTGSSLARYMIWDGIRSVDYLMGRSEVDPERIGITGRSGGGTQTAYIAAMDERLRAAAPENYITSFEQLLKTRGPQDAEQNFYNGIAEGLDQADLLHVRAPKPALIVATTRDIFSIDGTQAAFAEVRRAYAALGEPGSISLSVDDAGHESTRKGRETLYAFFQQHLELPGDPDDLAVEQLTPDELRITNTGQVSTSFKGETVFSINRRESTALVERLEQRRRDLPAHLAKVRPEAARLAGREAAPKASAKPVFSGRYQRSSYAIEKYLLPVNDRYAIPVLVMRPRTPDSGRVLVYLHPGGKSAAAHPGGEMESLVKQGCTVIAPDIIGRGELGPGYLFNGHDRPNRQWYAYILMGKSIVGRQMTDLLRTVQFAQDQFGVAPKNLMAVARGSLGPLLLHTGAIDGIFARIALIESPVSYRSIVATEWFEAEYISSTVPAALTAYDLPDLAACLAPRRLLLANPSGGNGAAADTGTIQQDTAVIARAYSAAAKGDFVLLENGATSALYAALEEWLE